MLRIGVLDRILGKHPIELYFRDTQTKPDVGAREARSLILNEKVHLGGVSALIADKTVSSVLRSS